MLTKFDYNSFCTINKNKTIDDYYKELYNYNVENKNLNSLFNKYTKNKFLSSFFTEYNTNKNYEKSIEYLWKFYYYVKEKFDNHNFKDDNNLVLIEIFYAIIFDLIINIINSNEKDNVLFGNTILNIDIMIRYNVGNNALENRKIDLLHSSQFRIINHIRLYYLKICEKLKNLKNVDFYRIKSFFIHITLYNLKDLKQINTFLFYINGLKFDKDNKDKIIEINEILIYFIKIFDILFNNKDINISFESDNDLIISNFKVLLTFLSLKNGYILNQNPQKYNHKKTQYIDLLEDINNELEKKGLNQIAFIDEINLDIINDDIYKKAEIERKRNREKKKNKRKRNRKIITKNKYEC